MESFGRQKGPLLSTKFVSRPLFEQMMGQFWLLNGLDHHIQVIRRSEWQKGLIGSQERLIKGKVAWPEGEGPCGSEFSPQLSVPRGWNEDLYRFYVMIDDKSFNRCC